jgi:dipeptidyl-peptidase-4
VLDAWTNDHNPPDRALFHQALADDGYLIASFDNRGTPAPKGRAWRKSFYGAAGVLATQDQTEAVLALARQRPYIDSARVGVWGWSSGGSNTLNLMFRSPDLFRVGVAVAPVPDLTLYDTIYSERYMGLPDENAAVYHDGSAINLAEGLRGKLLIIHGSGDDNVHFQGTEKLLNRLIELGKPIEFMEYPNRTHAISEGQGTTLHVMSLIARYFEEHLPAGPLGATPTPH